MTKRPHEWRPLDCDAWLARATVGIDQNVIGLVRNGDRPASGKAPGGRLYAAVGALRPGRGAGATGSAGVSADVDGAMGMRPADGIAMDTDHLERSQGDLGRCDDFTSFQLK